MTRENFQETMNEMFKLFKSDNREETTEVFWRLFRGINSAVFRQAAEHVMATRKYSTFPKPGDIKAAMSVEDGGGFFVKHYPENPHCQCPGCLVHRRADQNDCIYCGKPALSASRIKDPDYAGTLDEYQCQKCHDDHYVACMVGSEKTAQRKAS